MDTTAKRLKWISSKIRLAASAAIDSCNRIAYFPNGVKDLDQDDLTLTEPEVRDALDALTAMGTWILHTTSVRTSWMRHGRMGCCGSTVVGTQTTSQFSPEK